ncbi:alpha/beta hydrolase [Acinetobacter sp. ANC 4173]|uniref:alpha/beta hydrolase n=1 Tax=Acinetobacter sp. ANC 4173 TaxID=2529837 RepID=UPI00103F53F6|nr:alpha/beta fold hydrolase [Acinetobacter sp. ANC 4173]TCB80709.1 alpha/beta fold hydrolase [Acinetobacter sp. ANC 4173]
MQRRILIAVLTSTAMLLSACNDDHDSYNSGDNIPKNNIANPVVSTPTLYNLTDMSATAGESVVMTYKMLGINNEEVQATALVFTPKTAPPAKGWPIVVWAHGTTGVADICAPSRSQLNSYIKSMIDGLLTAGYVVVAPDYEGLGEPANNELHPFLNVKSEAFSITDAVVAARNYLGNKVSNRWMTVGHSQGGHAALSAAQYQSRAQLDYKGTVAVAPASNLELILLAGESLAAQQTDLTDKITTLASLDTFTALITAGLRNQNPTLQYSQVFKSPTDQIADNAETDCYISLGQEFGLGMQAYAQTHAGDISNYPRTQSGFMTLSPVKKFLDIDSQPLQVKISTPIIIYQGAADTTVPKLATDSLLDGDAAKNSPITYRTNTTWDHGTAYVLNIPNILIDVQTLMPIQ